MLIRRAGISGDTGYSGTGKSGDIAAISSYIGKYGDFAVE